MQKASEAGPGTRGRGFSKTFETLDENKLATVQTLISNAAFISVTLEDLQQTINQNGVSEEYKNGANQWGRKQSPETEVYISLTRNLNTIIKQLADLAPPAAEKNSKIAEIRANMPPPIGVVGGGRSGSGIKPISQNNSR